MSVSAKLIKYFTNSVFWTRIKELFSIQGSEKKQDRWVDRAGGVDARLTCSEDYVPDSEPQHFEYVGNDLTAEATRMTNVKTDE